MCFCFLPLLSLKRSTKERSPPPPPFLSVVPFWLDWPSCTGSSTSRTTLKKAHSHRHIDQDCQTISPPAPSFSLPTSPPPHPLPPLPPPSSYLRQLSRSAPPSHIYSPFPSVLLHSLPLSTSNLFLIPPPPPLPPIASLDTHPPSSVLPSLLHVTPTSFLAPSLLNPPLLTLLFSILIPPAPIPLVHYADSPTDLFFSS